ncbi:NUDIX hydrolase [Patescibacteria group bacterium]|nr:NUDIX hydrolase [Patescibacteria group bacterium]
MNELPKRPMVGAANIILNEKGEILLMKRAKESKTFPDMWGLVGGVIDWGETPAEAAKREAMEEIGVEVEVLQFVGRYYLTDTKSKGKVIGLPHYARIVSGTPHAAQPEETQEVKWFLPEEVRNMELAYKHKQILEDEGLI